MSESTQSDLPDSPHPEVERSTSARALSNSIFRGICGLTAAASVLVLVVLLGAIIRQGAPNFDWGFLQRTPDPDPSKAGIGPALWGTVWVCATCALFTLPIGVATAILLEEFQPRSTFGRGLHSIIQVNIANLAGVPSVVYGILGLTAFVSAFGLFGPQDRPFEIGVRYLDQYITAGDRVLVVPTTGDRPPAKAEPGMTAQTPGGRPVEVNVIARTASLPADPELLGRTLRQGEPSGRISRKSWYYISIPLGRGVLAGGLTLMLVILPIVIIASQEALRAVPNSLREAALGMGCTRWQMVWNVTLPAAVPGIMTGAILSMSRAIGEAAPILMLAGTVFITKPPRHLVDQFTVMPLQIYNWVKRPTSADAGVSFQTLAATGIIVLLAVLLTFNAIAVLIRSRTRKSQ